VLKTFMLDSYEVARRSIGRMISSPPFARGTATIPSLSACAVRPGALDAGVAGRFLYDYRKTVSDLIIENHFRAVRDLLNGEGCASWPRRDMAGMPEWTP